ncbi:short chain dehydrogenase/ reductase [Mytilinidion resinicola]|uniref:Short chain dehydrogenase/ reductase n=1 Tax=Mytilinidion resinicola TaxID=574789 RepID=A0A6A6YPB2_9PEZI|nr:short chain dehydrogenase/ reductase [Mytilinidion resinicola]KAF2809854.1 short chain dehydrogenase/ reductase [Mytilinidion resinicola]
MGLSLNGVLFITGAGGSIGTAILLQFARDGCTKISAVDISAAALASTATALATQFPDVELLQNTGDITNEADIDRIFASTVKRFGRIDYAVNNAGVGAQLRPTTEVPSSDYDRVLNINLKGTWLCEKAELKIMEAQEPLVSVDAVYVFRGLHNCSTPGLEFSTDYSFHSVGRIPSRGSIVNIDSVLGMLVVPGNAIYAMSKHGLLGLTRTDALDFAKKGVRVNAVCPGFVDTPLVTDAVKKVLKPNIDKTPMGRLAHVQEIADGVAFLASERASYITGTALTVSGPEADCVIDDC